MNTDQHVVEAALASLALIIFCGVLYFTSRYWIKRRMIKYDESFERAKWMAGEKEK